MTLVFWSVLLLAWMGAAVPVALVLGAMLAARNRQVTAPSPALGGVGPSR